MVDTGFMVPDTKLDRFAANYSRTADKKLVLIDDPERSGYRKMPSFLSGGGGLVSTTYGPPLFDPASLDATIHHLGHVFNAASRGGYEPEPPSSGGPSTSTRSGPRVAGARKRPSTPSKS